MKLATDAQYHDRTWPAGTEIFVATWEEWLAVKGHMPTISLDPTDMPYLFPDGSLRLLMLDEV